MGLKRGFSLSRKGYVITPAKQLSPTRYTSKQNTQDLFMLHDKTTPETDRTASHEGSWDTKALRMTALAKRLEIERNYYKQHLDWEGILPTQEEMDKDLKES